MTHSCCSCIIEWNPLFPMKRRRTSNTPTHSREAWTTHRTSQECSPRTSPFLRVRWWYQGWSVIRPISLFVTESICLWADKKTIQKNININFQRKKWVRDFVQLHSGWLIRRIRFYSITRSWRIPAHCKVRPSCSDTISSIAVYLAATLDRG